MSIVWPSTVATALASTETAARSLILRKSHRNVKGYGKVESLEKP